MARGFGSTDGVGTTDKITTALTSHATQRSYFLWTYRHGDGGGSGFGRMFDKLTAGSTVELLFNDGFNTPFNRYFYQRNWSGGNSQWAWTRPSADAWHSIGVAYDASSASNDPTVYQDGSIATVSNISRGSGSPLTNTDPYVLGNRGSDNARNWDGREGEYAVWDRILTADEWVSLSKGFSPLFFPNGLVEYVPMVRDLVSLIRGSPTATGTAVKEHPRIIYPTIDQIAKFRATPPPVLQNIFGDGLFS